jgi:putative heme iron utilization protein
MHVHNLFAGLAGVVLTAVAGIAPAASDPASPPAAACASPEEAARVRAKYASGPAPLPFQAAAELKLTESTIASALPPALSLGVDGTHFRAIWDSLGGWGETMILLLKGANVIEVHSKVPAGEPSSRSKFFNLGEAAFSGHLRPDLVTAIHIFAMQGREGMVRGVFFYDESGANVFGVFIGGEGAEPAAGQIAAFERTWSLFKGLPRRCGAAP